MGWRMRGLGDTRSASPAAGCPVPGVYPEFGGLSEVLVVCSFTLYKLAPNLTESEPVSS